MNNQIISRVPTLAKFGLAALAALAATGIAGTSVAHADNSNLSLGSYSIPTKAPSYQKGGDMLAKIPGTLGNASELFVYQNGNTNQDLTIQGSSTAWGTPVVTAPSTDSKAQQWYFQLVGNTTVQTTEYNFYGQSATVSPTVPVYRAISYNGGSPTCLDVYGGSGDVGSTIDAYGCNPNGINQSNQLWVVVPTAEENVNNSGENIVNSTLSRAGNGEPSSIIESVASLEANDWNVDTTPVVTAGIDDIDGLNSSVQLIGQSTWPADVYNSTFLMVDPNAPTSTSSGSNTPSCSMFACLVDL